MTRKDTPEPAANPDLGTLLAEAEHHCRELITRLEALHRSQRPSPIWLQAVIRARRLQAVIEHYRRTRYATLRTPENPIA